jgi:hypothetical protein
MLKRLSSHSMRSDPLSTWLSLFVGQPPAWVWCGQCHRAAKLREARCVHGVWRCHYPDCDGVLTDFGAWQVMRTAHPEWPRVPTMHVAYAVWRET